MKPVGINQISEPGRVRHDGTHVQGGTPRHGNERALSRAAEPSMVVRSAAASAGDAPPLDQDRVEQIRQALKDGSYPLAPTRVADAIIAARYMLAP